MTVTITINGMALDPDEWLYASPDQRAAILADARAQGFEPVGPVNLDSGIPPRLVYVVGSPVPSDPQIGSGITLGGVYAFGGDGMWPENFAPGLFGKDVLTAGSSGFDPCGWLKARGVLPQSWQCSWLFIGLGLALAAGIVGGTRRR